VDADTHAYGDTHGDRNGDADLHPVADADLERDPDGYRQPDAGRRPDRGLGVPGHERRWLAAGYGDDRPVRGLGARAPGQHDLFGAQRGHDRLVPDYESAPRQLHGHGGSAGRLHQHQPGYRGDLRTGWPRQRGQLRRAGLDRHAAADRYTQPDVHVYTDADGHPDQ